MGFYSNYFQVEYEPDSLEVLKNGAEISLVHWKMDRYLNSHNVASLSDIRNYEVSGFTNFNNKSKTEVYNEVALDAPPAKTSGHPPDVACAEFHGEIRQALFDLRRSSACRSAKHRIPRDKRGRFRNRINRFKIGQKMLFYVSDSSWYCYLVLASR